MKKTKKYLIVLKKYSAKKREPDIKVLDLIDTEEEAIKLCRKQYTDYIEVWAENWPQDKLDHNVREKELVKEDFGVNSFYWGGYYGK